MARKLCYICEATQGGVRKHLVQLLRVFGKVEEGFEVHAILGDRGEPGFVDELEELRKNSGLQYQFVPEFRREVRLWGDLRAYMQIKEILRVLQPDIVHTHSSKAGILGRQAAWQLDIKNIFHTPHVFPFQWTTGFRGRIYLAMERHAAKQCHRIICVGESQRVDALARNVAPPEKLIVIRNGIQMPEPVSTEERISLRNELGLPPEARIVGMVARLAPQKGVGMFVKAAAQVLTAHPDVVFALIGDGPLESDVRARMKELNLRPEQFRLLGHQQQAERLYPAFDLVALSSLYEGLPYVLLEAMSYGIPVVATDVLGSRDVVVDGVTGFLSRPHDAAHLASRIQVLLEDTDFQRRCGEAARQRVQGQFSFETFASEHRRLYAGQSQIEAL